MNFKDVIISGIKNTNNKGDLKSYFIREFKKAERDNFYTIETFFNPLFQLVNSFKQELERLYEKRKTDLEIIIKKAGNNEYNFYDAFYGGRLNEEGITYSDFKKQSNELWFIDSKKELSEISLEKIRTVWENLSLNDIQIIEEGLQKALNEIKPKAKEVPGKNTGSISKSEDGNIENRYKELKDIFVSEAAYNDAINALIKVEPAVISPDKRYLLGERMKSCFAAWYDALQRRGKIVAVEPAVISQLLNKEIKGLDLGADGKTLRATDKSKARTYKLPFLNIIK